MLFLKDGTSELSKVVTKQSNGRRKKPEHWKVERILPLFKKGDKEKTQNYHPISNLCSIT
jgi:hypothetical protein